MRYGHNYLQQGLWAWNDELFMSKLTPGQDDECWLTHTFPRTPFGPLFNARLHRPDGTTRRQMTQARRVQAMRYFGDIVGKQVTHTCGCKDCLNPLHLELKPSKSQRHQG